jgi:twitching motility two-component system response regulator PilH
LESEGTAHRATGAERKILVVDDSAEIRAVLHSVLTSAGYAVETADDGETAIEKIRDCGPDLVILDMVMPGVNGWGVLRSLHQNQVASPPVITVSGEYVSPAALALAHKSVRAHVLKPFHMATLLNTCEAVLSPETRTKGPMREQRALGRRPILATVTLLSADRTPLAVGRAIDLSLVGMRIHLGADLIPGQRVRLALELPGVPDPVYLRGVAHWSNDGIVGVELSDLGPEVAITLKAFLDSA